MIPSYINDWLTIIEQMKNDNTYKLAWGRAIIECITLKHCSEDNEHIIVDFDDISRCMIKYYWNQMFFFHLKQSPYKDIRSFSVQRKSFQCAGSYQGARHSSVMFTLVQNALLNGLDVRKYIGYVFENIKKAASMESLMPYSDEMKRFRTKELIESEIK